MTPKENALEVINWGNPESIPYSGDIYINCRMPTGVVDQPWTGGVDSFGTRWVATPEGAMPDPGIILFEDIEDWREYIKFPDLDKIDFHAMAATELANADRSQKLVNLLSVCGGFERLAAFMGFENALCAFAENPEECKNYFRAMTDFRIEFLKRVFDAYHPDIVNFFDDVATSRGLFIAPETWREIIKPELKRLVDFVSENGVIFSMHCCGMCSDIVEDFAECGVRIWSSAQTSNDIVALKEKVRGRMVIEGGWDTTGPVSMPGGTVEMALEEAKRCAEEYGPGGGFILMIILLNEKGNALRVGDPRLDAIQKVWPEMSLYK